MTNEEIVMLIKVGQTELYSQLWTQCEKFIRKKAYQWKYSHDSNIIDIDDLTQAGYFALMKAVDYYKPESGYKLLTYLTTLLKTAFCQTCGIGTHKRDAADYALSIEEPLSDDTEHCRGDVIPDCEAQRYIESIADKDLYERAKSVLSLALDTIPAKEKAFIIAVYYDRLTLGEASTAADYDSSVLPSAVHCSALNRLRYCKYAPLMKKYLSDMECCDISELQSMAYTYTGLSTFRHTRESSVERAALINISKQSIKGGHDDYI